MPALFPVWSDTALRLALLAIAGAVPGAFVVPMIIVRTPDNLGRNNPVEQPVQFDHRHHVQDDGIECLYCHSGAERTATAGIPPTELCMGCHSQIWSQALLLEPVRRSYFSGQPLQWSRVNDVPDFVYFNHAIHVRGGIGCQECHGDISRMARVRQVKTLTMGFCLDCHRARQVTVPPEAELPSLTNCSTCHR